MQFFNSLQSEWLKTKRSAASWLCLSGGLFLPLLYLAGFLKDHRTINTIGRGANSWETLNVHLWGTMGTFLLPMGIVLAASLIPQIEYRNHGWKLLHTTPQRYHTIFLAKLGATLLLLAKFFLFFNAGMLLAGIVPSLLVDGRWPADPFPADFLLRYNVRLFLTCLPVLALQFVLSMLCRNFLAPAGIGLLAVTGTLILVQLHHHAWMSPYSCSVLLVLRRRDPSMPLAPDLLAVLYFLAIAAAGYVLYVRKKDKA